MKIDAELVKRLRTGRHWSQDQLAEACGLNPRTIQRLEATGKGSMESVRALAAVFEIDADELIMETRAAAQMTPLDAVRNGFTEFANFSGTASRAEYWWFFVFVLLLMAVASVLHPNLYQLVGLIVVLPFLAVGTRRLHDTGESGWWQLLALVPFGIFVVLFMLARKGGHRTEDQRTRSEAGAASARRATDATT